MSHRQHERSGWLARMPWPIFVLLLVGTAMATSFCFLVIAIGIGDLSGIQEGPGQDALFGLLSLSGFLVGAWLLIAARRRNANTSRIGPERTEPALSSLTPLPPDRAAPAIRDEQSTKDQPQPDRVSADRASTTASRRLSWRAIAFTACAGGFVSTMQSFPLFAACLFAVLIPLLWTTTVWPGLTRQQALIGKVVITATTSSLLLWNLSDGVPLTIHTLPTCDSRSAISTLKRAVKESPRGRTLGVELVDMNDVRELSWDEKAEVRMCQAEGFYNSGREYIRYRIIWIDKSKGSWWIEVIPLLTPRWRF